MRARTLAILMVWLWASGISYAQTDWMKVVQLPAQTPVRLQGDGGHARIEGLLQSVNDDEIVLSRDGRSIAIERRVVRRVDRVEPPDRQAGARRGFWIGLAVGVLGGFGAGMEEGTKAIPIAMAVFGAAGAGLGATTASSRYVRVYSRH